MRKKFTWFSWVYWSLWWHWPLVPMVALAACTKEVEVIKGVEVIEEVEVEKSTTSRLDVVKARGKVICASRNDVPGSGSLDAAGNNVGLT